jgi:hypothetical protein
VLPAAAAAMAAPHGSATAQAIPTTTTTPTAVPAFWPVVMPPPFGVLGGVDSLFCGGPPLLVGGSLSGFDAGSGFGPEGGGGGGGGPDLAGAGGEDV